MPVWVCLREVRGPVEIWFLDQEKMKGASQRGTKESGHEIVRPMYIQLQDP